MSLRMCYDIFEYVCKYTCLYVCVHVHKACTNNNLLP